MTLATRARKAKNTFDLGHVTGRNGNGMASTIVVPGRRAKLHMVILKWPTAKNGRPSGVVDTECFITSNNQMAARCKGNLSGVCYHVISAVNLALAERGYTTAWVKKNENANRVKNLHPGSVKFMIRGFNYNALYVVAWQDEKVTRMVPQVAAQKA